ncbi:MAG: PEP-CTERM sorting domain-containing protein [Phycisphaerae bacterium]
MSSQMGMRTVGVLSAVMVGLLASAACASFAPITLGSSDFNSLLGGPPTPIDSPLVTPMSNDNLHTAVTSQAFTDGAGHYIYLYQVANTGSAGDAAAEFFTVSAFYGLTASGTAGRLTANPPTGFSLGTQAPAGASVDVPAGPVLSFAFPGAMGYSLDPGETSVALYVLSDMPPEQVTGNVINGTIASGPVVAPVPEPTTVSLLVLGAGMMLFGRRSARR